MKIHIEYNLSVRPTFISFIKTQECDPEIFIRILEKVMVENFANRMKDFTYIGIRNSSIEIELENGKLQEFSFTAESDLVERIIHYTVANHFYTVKSEVAMIVREKNDIRS